MGLIALSTILAIILGSCVWLVIGDQFPVNEDIKWPTVNNICCYSVAFLIPIYLIIFFLF